MELRAKIVVGAEALQFQRATIPAVDSILTIVAEHRAKEAGIQSELEAAVWAAQAEAARKHGILCRDTEKRLREAPGWS